MSFPFFTEQASDYARDVDYIFFALLALTIIFTMIVLSTMIFLAVRYRRGSKVDRSNPSIGDLRFEIAWSIIPLVIGIVMFAWAAKPYTQVFSPPADAAEIFVIGKRWMWHIQHPNGIRENNELHIPVNRAVKLTMISQDVIHGFSVPAFRAKRDVLPGRYNTFWFQPNKTGKFHLFCTEYCGTNHSEMGGWVYVMSPADYQKWEQNGGNTDTAQKMTLEQEGENLYQTLACANCHADQNNVHGPSLYGLYKSSVHLTNGDTVKADDDYIRESIVNPGAKIVAGYENIMQGYEVGDGPGYLNEEQILSLLAYIKTLGTTSGNMVQSPTSTKQSQHPNGKSKPGSANQKSPSNSAAFAQPASPTISLHANDKISLRR